MPRRRALTTVLAHGAYVLATYLLAPLLGLALLVRLWRRPTYRQRLRERFGFIPRLGGPVLWLHAVSVGESQAAVPLVRALRARYPDWTVLVSTTTPTGAANVRRTLGEQVVHAYMPYDLLDCVHRFLARCNAAVLVVVETELWPNLLHACGARGVPMIMASARLSARSLRGYQRLAALFRPAPTQVLRVGAQTVGDAERFRALFKQTSVGVQVTGNIKFDLEVDPATVATGQAWRNAYVAPEGACVLVAGSTHEGEEDVLLDALEALLAAGKRDYRLVLVPRHPERFDAVATLVAARGLRLYRHTRAGESSAQDAQVFLVDTMGELQAFYGGRGRGVRGWLAGTDRRP